MGAECNRLLDYADELESTVRTEEEQQLAADIRSLVERVATFEELETKS